MKRLFILLFSIFICSIAHADTETINWYVDGNSYATTTCQTGGDIILPNTPYKYGYTFQGWNEFFYRGQYTNFKNVPSNTSYYLSDYHNNTTPKNNDYIIIDDASDYIGDAVEITYQVPSAYGKANITFSYLNTINGERTEQTVYFDLNGCYTPKRTVNDPITFNGRVLFYVIGGGDRVSIIPMETLIINGATVQKNTSVLLFSGYCGARSGAILFSKSGDFLSGSWQFSYHGLWEDKGIDGWLPDKQL